MVMDVNERKQLDQRANGSPDLFASIIRSAMDAIIAVDERSLDHGCYGKEFHQWCTRFLEWCAPIDVVRQLRRASRLGYAN